MIIASAQRDRLTRISKKRQAIRDSEGNQGRSNHDSEKELVDCLRLGHTYATQFVYTL
jgi:hypothetical protein